jgi:hypothetical protein
MRVGWEFCHSMIDDHSRLAYTEIQPDEKAPTVVGFVEFPRFRGHLIAGPSGPAVRIGVHAVNPAVSGVVSS